MAGIVNQPALADLPRPARKVPAEVPATETVAGIAELATQAEVNTGTDALRIVTPATLDAFINGKTDTVITAADEIAFADVGSANVARKDTVQGILDLTTTLVLGTEQATTSGTAFDFTSIPTGTKRVTITFQGVSLSAADALLVQIGDAGGIETSGYVSTGANVSGATSSTAGFLLRTEVDGRIASGHMVLTLSDSANFTWIASHAAKVATDNIAHGGGDKSLSAELTQVRITRTGTDTFDAGALNILFE